MANILLTNRCVRSCPYCFAKQHLETAPPTDLLTLENLVYITDFLIAGGESSVSLLGGEPLLHPQCMAIAKYLTLRGLNVTIFTSGITSPSNLESIKEDLKYLSPRELNIVVNYNNPDNTAPAEIQRIDAFLEACAPFCSLGINIYRQGFSYDYVVEAKSRFNLQPSLRIGLAHPIPGTENNCLPPNKAIMRSMADDLVKAIPMLENAGMKISMDCGFPLCAFSDDALGVLYRHNPSGMRFKCGSAIDISPEMLAWNCFPLENVHCVSLFEFNSFAELKEHFKDYSRSIRQNNGIFKECSDCSHKEICDGGCLSHILKRKNGNIMN